MKVNLVMQDLPCCGPKKNNLNGSNCSVSQPKSFGSSGPDVFVKGAGEELTKALKVTLATAKKPDGRLRFPNFSVENSSLPDIITPEQAEAAKLALEKRVIKKGNEEFWLNSKNIEQLDGMLAHINIDTIGRFKNDILPLVKYWDTPHDLTFLLGALKFGRAEKVDKMLPHIAKLKFTFYQLAHYLCER